MGRPTSRNSGRQTPVQMNIPPTSKCTRMGCLNLDTPGRLPSPTVSLAPRPSTQICILAYPDGNHAVAGVVDVQGLTGERRLGRNAVALKEESVHWNREMPVERRVARWHFLFRALPQPFMLVRSLVLVLASKLRLLPVDIGTLAHS